MVVVYFRCDYRPSCYWPYHRRHRLLQATAAKKGKHVGSSRFSAGIKKSDRLGMDQWLNIIAMEVCHHGS